MAKVELINIASLQNETSAVLAINTNSNRIVAAMENTLSRDGDAPNELNAELDMNNNRIYNLPEAVENTEAVRFGQIKPIIVDMEAAVDAAEAARDTAVAAAGTAVAAKNGAELAAAQAAASLDSFTDMYLGVHPTPPGFDPDGNPLVEGAIFFLTDQIIPEDEGLYIFRNGMWQKADIAPVAYRREAYSLANDGSTVFNITGGYVPGGIDIYRNGVKQRVGTVATLGTGPLDSDVAAENGTSIQFPAGTLVKDDLIYYITYSPFEIASMQAQDVQNIPSGTVSALTVQAAIAELDAEKVPTTRTITASGLVTGGGDLSADRVINVDKASSAEVITGTNDTKATTPLGVAAAITAAGANNGTALITSGTNVAAQATIDLALTGGYRSYRLIVDQLEPVTAAQIPKIRFSYDGGGTYESGATAYVYAGYRTLSDATSATFSSAGQADFSIGGAQPAAGGQIGFFEVDLSVPAGAGRVVGVKATSTSRSTTGSVDQLLVLGGRCTTSSARPTHVRIFYNSGNIAADARWMLYGMRN